MLLNQVEVQLLPKLRNHFARNIWLCKPLHRKYAAGWTPDECHGRPLVMTGMRGVAVAKLDVLARPIDRAFLPRHRVCHRTKSSFFTSVTPLPGYRALN